jgi:cell division protein FtsB
MASTTAAWAGAAGPLQAPSGPARQDHLEPELRPGPETAKRRRRRAVVLALLAAGVVLAVAAAHAEALAEQLRVDRLDARIAQVEQRNQHLEVKIAELDAPARIVAQAKANGMVEPTHVTYVFPPGTKVTGGNGLEPVGSESQAALARARSLVK